MNPLDILGSLIQNGMGASTGRLDRTLGNEGLGGLGGMYGKPAGMPAGGGLALLAGLAAKALGGSMPRTGSVTQPRAGAPAVEADDLTALIAGLRQSGTRERTLAQDVAALPSER